ncbi:MAG: M28 family peptidase [Salinivirgaceae bacterium]|nr:M28 family peptidase [Salinivirgaceae bacterium]
MMVFKFFKRFVIFFSLIVCVGLASFGQNFVASKDTIKHHVYHLASEELKGRATGSEGQKMAAKYISNAFESYGLSKLPNNSYYQYYYLSKKPQEIHTIKNNDNRIFWPWDFYFAGSNNHTDTIKSSLLFCGYGTEKEIENIEIEGKTIAFIAHCPKQAFEKIKQIRKTYGNKNFVILFPEKNKDVEKAWSVDYELSYYSLPKDFDRYYMSRIEEEWANPSVEDSLRIYYCFQNVMEKVFGISDEQLEQIAKDNLKTGSLILDTFPHYDLTLISDYDKSIEKTKVENVGGIIYGKDTTQTIVITAHYDHIGEVEGNINYGADDNASGVSAVLEAARQLSQYFSNEKKPCRNILFLTFSGEEIGLFGSQAYVQDPIFSLDETVLNINIDMVGRWDERHTEDRDFVYLLTLGENSKDYFKLGKKQMRNARYFKVSNKPGPKEMLIFKYGSDHYSFYKKGVPIALFFTGLHEDYHTPNDVPEKINYSNLTNITNLLSKFVYQISMDTVNYPLRKNQQDQ